MDFEDSSLKMIVVDNFEDVDDCILFQASWNIGSRKDSFV